jgi:RecA/RadA recombinase
MTPDLTPASLEVLQRLAAMAPVTPAPTAVTANGTHHADDEMNVAEEFKRRGWYRKPLRNGKHAVQCPWESEHSVDSGITECALFDPRPPSTAWGFKCQHQHCAGRTIRDIYALLRGQPTAPAAVTIPPPQGLADVLASVVTNLRQGPRRAIKTPFTGLNYLIHGFHPGELTYLGGRPGDGKTALDLEISAVAAQAGHAVTIISREMSRDALGRRVLAQHAGVHAGKLRAGTLDPADWAAIDKALPALNALNVQIEDSVATIEQVAAVARRNHAERGLDLLVVDYLQLLQTQQHIADRRLSVEYISQALKGLALELKTSVLVLSSMNRPMKGIVAARPTLHDLRESGQLEHDADLVMFLYRPESLEPADKGRAVELIVAKARDGAQGVVHLRFWPATLTFMEVEEPR